MQEEAATDDERERMRRLRNRNLLHLCRGTTASLVRKKGLDAPSVPPPRP